MYCFSLWGSTDIFSLTAVPVAVIPVAAVPAAVPVDVGPGTAADPVGGVGGPLTSEINSPCGMMRLEGEAAELAAGDVDSCRPAAAGDEADDTRRPPLLWGLAGVEAADSAAGNLLTDSSSDLDWKIMI